LRSTQQLAGFKLMASPTIDTESLSTLFTMDSPSKAGQAEAGLVAGLYLIAWMGLTAQIPGCKGKYYAAIVTSLFAAGQYTLICCLCNFDFL